jgi:hypothetical protein
VKRRLRLTGFGSTREHPRALGVLAAAVAALAILLFAAPALAQNKAVETQARALQKKAMEEDYLNVDLDKATDKLNQAITKCGTDKCSSNLRALLRRDLSTVYSAANKKDEAMATMVEALKIDGTIQLDANYKTKEIEAIYAAAKTRGGGGAPSSGGGGGTPSGDFTHTPAAEQAIRTPLPVYVEYGGSEAVTKVVVKYKAFGMTEFKTLELKKMGTGWGGNIPCADILEGDTQYYIQGFNANNDPVATGGDRNHPYKVTISKTIAGDAPHLPGQQPLAQCAETGDCPPDFPGCKKGAGVVDDNLKGAGEDCEEDAQCKSGTCKDEKCTAPPDEGENGEPRLRHFWVGVAFSLDLQFISGANNVCALNPMTAAPITSTYACLQNGSNYPAGTGSNGFQNAALIIDNKGKSDSVSGGIAPANLRFLASFDYAFNYNIMAGARVGYVALAYTGSNVSAFPPIHLEARATYVFGHHALVQKGIRPVVLFAAGAAPFSAHVGVSTLECDNNPTMQTPVGSGATGTCTVNPKNMLHQAGIPVLHGVDAWRVGGPVFVAPGAGIRWGFSARAALSLNVKLAMAFGNGFIFDPTPELFMQFGF